MKIYGNAPWVSGMNMVLLNTTLYGYAGRAPITSQQPLQHMMD